MSKIHDPSDPGRINDIIDQLIEEHYKEKANHVARTLTMDEVWITDALDLYDSVEKHPVSGLLHRQHASDILGRLSKCNTDTLHQMAAETHPGEIVGKMTNARSVFRRMAQILLTRREKGRRSVTVN